ncbi:CHAT domain-containing protein [Mycena capillaripes]|nr:CHAT domain-containing protein [Mycena capillaripes]
MSDGIVDTASVPFDFANEMLRGYKGAADIPALNTAIYILRHAIYLLRRDDDHSLDPRGLIACLNTFATAFLIRFSYTGEFTDILYALGLRQSASREPPTAGTLEEDLALPSFDIDGSEVEDDVSDIINCATTLLADFNASVNLSTVETIIDSHRRALARRAGSDPDMWKSLLALSEAVLIRFHSSGQPKDLEEVITLRFRLHPVQPNRVMGLCAAAITGLQPEPPVELDQLMVATQLFDEAMSIASRAKASFAPGNNLLVIFQRSEDLSDLNAAISLFEEAEHQLFLGHRHRLAPASDLAGLLFTRFNMCGTAADLDRAVDLYTEVLTLQRAWENNPTNLADLPTVSPGHLRRQVELRTTLCMLMTAFQVRFKETGQIVDLEEGIKLHDEALALSRHKGGDTLPNTHPDTVQSAADSDSQRPDSPPVPQPSQSHYLFCQLGFLLYERFKQKADVADLDRAIGLYRRALRLPVQSSTIVFSNLGSALFQRFQISGSMCYLDEAIDADRKALELLPASSPTRHFFVSILAIDLRERWSRLPNSADLESTIKLYREALTLQLHSHPRREASLVGLGTALWQWVRRRADMSDLEDYIEVQHELLSLRPVPHSHRRHTLRNLAIGLHRRCRYRESASDLNTAIELQREAVALVPVSDSDRGVHLDTLASLLLTRFKQRGDITDFDTSISLHREAITVFPTGHSGSARLRGNLAAALALRYSRTHERNDFDEAIDLRRQALALQAAPHIDRADSLHNLSTLLHQRINQNKDAADINDPIGLNREALEYWEASHTSRGYALNTIGLLFALRFKQRGESMDLDGCLESLKQALDELPEPNPERGGILSNIAGNLILKYKHSGEQGYLDEGIDTFSKAFAYSYNSVSRRLSIADRWGALADEIHHKSALSAYRLAIELLPQLAMVGLDIHARRKALTLQRKGLASDAADCAIKFDDLDNAVELLEEGRSVFWSQALQLRTPLDDLRLADPGLAARVSDILATLEKGSHSNLSVRSTLAPYSEEYVSLEAEATNYSQLNAEWMRTLDDIRQQKEFENFLRPKRLQELRSAALHGPVIILNGCKSQCTALIITLDQDVQCLSLPDITFQSAGAMARFLVHGMSCAISVVSEEFLMAQNDEYASEAWLMGKREGTQKHDTKYVLKLILAKLWRAVAKPVLSALILTESKNPPRVWWCPTGPFSFLPIHAAGVYEEDKEISVCDYVISSYAPTLGTLLRPPPTTTQFKMTAIIQPAAVDLPGLRYTKDELSRIEERIPKQWLTSLGRTSQTTVDQALFHLQQSSVVHFACHGIQDSTNPLESGLLLADGRLKVSQIMGSTSGSPTETPLQRRMSLAFLSACETAKGDNELPDEAMHLAAGLLFTGFRGVVATMTMADADGPKIADDFYAHLFSPCDAASDPPILPDLTKAAEALHFAVGNLRKEPGISLRRWVPFVHYGL